MRSRRGYALFEFILAVAIMAVIGLGAGVVVMQTFKVTRQSSDWSRMVRQAQEAGFWISQDQLTAAEVQVWNGWPATPESGTAVITLDWDNWISGNVFEARYIWLDAGNSTYRIEREVKMNGIVQSRTRIAENVSSLAAVEDQGNWILNVAVSSSGRSLSRVYAVHPRSNYASE